MTHSDSPKQKSWYFECSVIVAIMYTTQRQKDLLVNTSEEFSTHSIVVELDPMQSLFFPLIMVLAGSSAKKSVSRRWHHPEMSGRMTKFTSKNMSSYQ
jgi:hypothetical protein